MVETNPTSHRAFGARGTGPVDFSKKYRLKQLALRVIAKGWRPPRPHVRLSMGRPVSQYAGNEGCTG
jgi:hypothetical protein